MFSLACFVVKLSLLNLHHTHSFQSSGDQGRHYKPSPKPGNIVDLTSKPQSRFKQSKQRSGSSTTKRYYCIIIVYLLEMMCEMWEDSENRLRLRIASLWAKGQFRLYCLETKKVVTTNTSRRWSQRFSTNALFGLTCWIVNLWICFSVVEGSNTLIM